MRCFPPVVDSNTRVLVLGSFPGPESLKQKQYYAFAHNAFWKCIGAAINENMSVPYEEKMRLLKKHDVGLWDVVQSCERATSADTHIRNVKLNNICRIIRTYPNIKRVVCNGTFSYAAAKKQLSTIEVVRAPSTSGRSAQLTLEQKKKLWAQAIHP